MQVRHWRARDGCGSHSGPEAIAGSGSGSKDRPWLASGYTGGYTDVFVCVVMAGLVAVRCVVGRDGHGVAGSWREVEAAAAARFGWLGHSSRVVFMCMVLRAWLMVAALDMSSGRVVAVHASTCWMGWVPGVVSDTF